MDIWKCVFYLMLKAWFHSTLAACEDEFCVYNDFEDRILMEIS